MSNMKQSRKTPAEIIAGALELFTHDDNGRKLKKARWNNQALFIEQDAKYDIENPLDTYCALGALRMSASGLAAYSGSECDAHRTATDIVAECIPKSTQQKLGYTLGVGMKGSNIPEWNDNLSRKRGFTSIKRVFCKALKVALERERPAAAKRRRKAGKKRAN